MIFEGEILNALRSNDIISLITPGYRYRNATETNNVYFVFYWHLNVLSDYSPELFSALSLQWHSQMPECKKKKTTEKTKQFIAYTD